MWLATADAQQVTLDVPDEVAGEFGLRYILSGKPRDRKLAATTFTVTDVSAMLSPPTAPIEAGAGIEAAVAVDEETLVDLK